jgi:hypothetical protein
MAVNRHNRGIILFLVCSICSSAFASAQIDFKTIPCSIITQVFQTFNAVMPALVMIMFSYGAVKYIYSADDAGGRKQGKTIIIHALIGGIIFSLTYVFYNTLSGSVTWWNLC